MKLHWFLILWGEVQSWILSYFVLFYLFYYFFQRAEFYDSHYACFIQPQIIYNVLVYKSNKWWSSVSNLTLPDSIICIFNLCVLIHFLISLFFSYGMFFLTFTLSHVGDRELSLRFGAGIKGCWISWAFSGILNLIAHWGNTSAHCSEMWEQSPKCCFVPWRPCYCGPSHLEVLVLSHLSFSYTLWHEKPLALL